MRLATFEIGEGIESKLGFGGEITSLADVRHLVFGQLVALAQPFVQHYHSDLYHDATWINENVTGDRVEFWFGADECGTNIGLSSTFVAGFRSQAWRVVCELRPNRWNELDAFITVSPVVHPEGWRK